MTDPTSRRTFLAATGMTAAHVWVPAGARGYSAAEMRAIENTIGVSKWELDTPALCVDLDALEANITTMQAPTGGARPRRAAARQDAQERRHRQEAAGGRRARHLHRQAERSRGA